ncbi:N-acetyltransferase [Helicobacter sp. 12S02634-8]|uniref:acyltransferase n=1 Tax=Helicobacter sp. 12S02634-8 TaxID=1476199 RepID=UPI000BA66043|nr:acyltransferase [Helicobacter sp. 12S02634-8]PAF48105.1 N-acetyltransferase [Helicobacter sp. 12S02634-8]
MNRYFIHPSSYIDTRVCIGDGSKIWHFCHILEQVSIGTNCSIGQNCSIGPRVSIGNGCKIQNNVSLYEGVKCEDDVFIGPSAVFTNVYNPRAFIIKKSEYKTTLLKKGCTIGANATIVCGVSIGEYAFVAAGAVVREDVKPFALVAGVSARQIGWVDKAGNKMIFDTNNRAFDSYDGTQYSLVDGGILIEKD